MIGFLSILTPIEDVLTWMLEWLHTTLGFTWAWSIVVLTITVRMLLVPLTVKQIHSMQRMQQHLSNLSNHMLQPASARAKHNCCCCYYCCCCCCLRPAADCRAGGTTQSETLRENYSNIQPVCAECPRVV